MNYARIDDVGEVVSVRLPRHGALTDGCTVTNYHLLPAALLHTEGWRPLIDDGPPDYEPQTQQAVRTGHVYDDTDDVVRATWDIVDLPPDVPGDGHHDPLVGAPDA